MFLLFIETYWSVIEAISKYCTIREFRMWFRINLQILYLIKETILKVKILSENLILSRDPVPLRWKHIGEIILVGDLPHYFAPLKYMAPFSLAKLLISIGWCGLTGWTPVSCWFILQLTLISERRQWFVNSLKYKVAAHLLPQLALPVLQ